MLPGSITQPNWIPTVADDTDAMHAKKIPVPAQPAAGLWTRVLDFVPAGRKLKIQVVGTPEWIYDKTKTACAADGAPADGTGTLLPQAVIGCLIGKVGGSAADSFPVPPNAAAASNITNPSIFVFAVGSFCVVQVPTTVSGALFLTMNDFAANFLQHAGSVDVQVYDAS